MALKKTESEKQKKPRSAKKEFMAGMREKAEKRLAALMKKKAKQQNLDIEIAELHRFLGIDSELAARGEQKDMSPIRPGAVTSFSFPAADGE
jgi:hypothetical protein